MSSPLPTTIVCPDCGALLPVQAEACGRCGARLSVPLAELVLPARSAARQRRLLDTPWFILVLLFGVAAAFALPLLWSSRGFSLPVKIVLTVVVVLYTGLVLWLIWLLLVYIATAVAQLRDAW